MIQLQNAVMIQLQNAVEYFSNLILTELYLNGIDCWIAGGSVRDYFMGKPVKGDLDLFFPNEKEYEKAKDYLLKKSEAEKIWESENGMKVIYKGKKIDLVKKHFDSPKATIDAFDFTVSMFAVNIKNVFYGDTSFIDLSKRQLMINIITYPASTLSRTLRYYQKGFRMCHGELKKVIEAIQNMPKTEENTTVNNTDEENMSSGDAMFNGID